MPTGLRITVELVVHDAADHASVADLIGELLKLGVATPGFTVEVPAGPTSDVDRVETAAPDGGGRPPSAPPTAPPAAPRRVRDKRAERAARAERERAAAEATNVGKPNGAEPSDPDPADDDLLDPFGPDTTGSTPPTAAPVAPAALVKARTDQGYMDAALVVLRCVYESADGAAHVKALQKQHRVAKFTDLPLTEAPTLFRAAFDLAQTLNVSLPANL